MTLLVTIPFSEGVVLLSDRCITNSAGRRNEIQDETKKLWESEYEPSKFLLASTGVVSYNLSFFERLVQEEVTNSTLTSVLERITPEVISNSSIDYGSSPNIRFNFIIVIRETANIFAYFCTYTHSTTANFSIEPINTIDFRGAVSHVPISLRKIKTTSTLNEAAAIRLGVNMIDYVWYNIQVKDINPNPITRTSEWGVDFYVITPSAMKKSMSKETGDVLDSILSLIKQGVIDY